jgi:hypothetical protein
MDFYVGVLALAHQRDDLVAREATESRSTRRPSIKPRRSIWLK